MSSAQLRYMPPVIINNLAVSLCKLDLSLDHSLYICCLLGLSNIIATSKPSMLRLRPGPVPEKLDVPKFSISLNSVTRAFTSKSSNCALFKSNMDQCNICKSWVRFSSNPSLNEAITCCDCGLYYCNKTSTCGKS